MFGVGGGAVMVPAMVLLLGLDPKVSAGTSLAAQVLPIGLFGSIVYYRAGNLDIKFALILAAGLAIGNGFGAMFTNLPHVSPELVRKLFGVFLVVCGIRFLIIR